MAPLPSDTQGLYQPPTQAGKAPAGLELAGSERESGCARQDADLEGPGPRDVVVGVEVELEDGPAAVTARADVTRATDRTLPAVVVAV